VTTLIGTYPLNDNRNGILMCLRNDYEQLYSKDDMSRLKRRLNEISSRVEVTDTTCNDIPYSTLCSNLGKIIHDKIDYLSGFKVVITDRYHGTIFSMIANVPVIVLASTDHKVTTGLKWFNGVYDGNYYMAKSIDEAYTLAKEIIKSDIGKKNKPYFEEKYYSNLREMVGKL
jgi:exopolysaccharide biosynthesis predicted pyruvyltransferase EpsI